VSFNDLTIWAGLRTMYLPVVFDRHSAMRYPLFVGILKLKMKSCKDWHTHFDTMILGWLAQCCSDKTYCADASMSGCL
jgi:hypothetical protein